MGRDGVGRLGQTGADAMTERLGGDGAVSLVRCPWAEHGGAAERAYHDLEWGVPLHEERALFELLTLEGAQAGLSWSLVLGRREGYRRAFAGFDPDLIATWSDEDVDALVNDAAIIRNRGKIASVVTNARAVRELRNDATSFDAYLWAFTGGAPLQPRHTRAVDVPTTTELATALSRDLKRRGFRFVGPTIVYSFMQATGMTNDHVTGCFRFAELAT
ncbi:MAG: DNA-3-methyladenine glycosylase I [Acidimicrobiales bacterium]